MKFYDYCAAPSPRRARIFMAEKGIEIETEQVDLGVKAQFEPAYRAVNPRCTVPALVLDDGTVLSDNTSIARYLEEAFPDPPLLGTTPVEKALVAEWMSRAEGEGLLGVAEALRNRSEFFKDSSITGPDRYAQVPELVERGRARAQREMRAKEMCRRCPVITQCRTHALAVGEPYGIWGGLSESERELLLKRGIRRTA